MDHAVADVEVPDEGDRAMSSGVEDTLHDVDMISNGMPTDMHGALVDDHMERARELLHGGKVRGALGRALRHHGKKVGGGKSKVVIIIDGKKKKK